MCKCGTYPKCYCGREPQNQDDFATRVGEVRAYVKEQPAASAKPPALKYRTGTINVKLQPSPNGDVRVSAAGFNGEDLGIADGESFVWSRYDIAGCTELTLQIPVKLLDPVEPIKETPAEEPLTDADRRILQRGLVKLQQEVAEASITYRLARRLYGRLHAGTTVLLRRSTTSDG